MSALLLMIVAYARAEGMLAGAVVDEVGIPVPAMVVTVQGPNLFGERVQETDENGAFAFDGLPAGIYDVRFERHGFVAVKYRGVEVIDDRRVVLNVAMTVERAESYDDWPLGPSERVHPSGEARAWLEDPAITALPLQQRVATAWPSLTRPAATADPRYRYKVDGVDVSDVFGGPTPWVLAPDAMSTVVVTSGDGGPSIAGDTVAVGDEPVSVGSGASVTWEPTTDGARATARGAGRFADDAWVGASWGWQHIELPGDTLTAHRLHADARVSVGPHLVMFVGRLQPSALTTSGDTRSLALAAGRWAVAVTSDVLVDSGVSALAHHTLADLGRHQDTTAAFTTVTVSDHPYTVEVGLEGSRTKARLEPEGEARWEGVGSRAAAHVAGIWERRWLELRGGARLDGVRVVDDLDQIGSIDVSPRLTVGVAPESAASAWSVGVARFGPMTDLDPVRFTLDGAGGPMATLDATAGRSVDALITTWDQKLVGPLLLRADLQARRTSGPSGSTRTVQGAVLLDAPYRRWVFARARWVGTAGMDAPAPVPHTFDGYAGWTIPLDPWSTTVAALASVAGPSQQVGARVAQDVPLGPARLTVSVDALSQRGIPMDPWSPVVGPWAVLVGADVARR